MSIVSKPLRSVSFFVGESMNMDECRSFFETCIRSMYRGFVPNWGDLPGWQIDMLDSIIDNLGPGSAGNSLTFVGGNTVLTVYTNNFNPLSSWSRSPENYTLE